MFWRKKKDPQKHNDEVFDRLLKVLQLNQTELVRMDKEIEMIKIKLRSRAYKEKKADEEQSENIKYNDGFDELRQLNSKDGQFI